MATLITEKDIMKHPCFNEEAKSKYARVHLPVAPQCNIQCNYCNRKYDCVNESRPGVTSGVLTPQKAVSYLKELSNSIDNISVIGIAGPGDPFANPKETMETLRNIHNELPDKIFCLSSNGLGLEPYIEEIAELGVTHVTLTINAIDPEISAKIYRWVRFERKVYRGIMAAELLLERQLRCIPLLKAKGIVVKINSIIIPGVNDHHIHEVARVCKELGADIMNCIPLIPTADTPFEEVPRPTSVEILRVREFAKEHLPMMAHCARCRADAAGLLGQDLSDSYQILQKVMSTSESDLADKPYVAVATNEGHLVNLHLGEAMHLYIYQQTPKGFQYVELRKMPNAGTGDQRWLDLARSIKDCRALLVSSVGENPKSIIDGCGINVIEMTGLIDEGLEGVYNHKPIKTIAKPNEFKCGSGCKGTAMGCA